MWRWTPSSSHVVATQNDAASATREYGEWVAPNSTSSAVKLVAALKATQRPPSAVGASIERSISSVVATKAPTHHHSVSTKMRSDGSSLEASSTTTSARIVATMPAAAHRSIATRRRAPTVGRGLRSIAPATGRVAVSVEAAGARSGFDALTGLR